MASAVARPVLASKKALERNASRPVSGAAGSSALESSPKHKSALLPLQRAVKPSPRYGVLLSARLAWSPGALRVQSRQLSAPGVLPAASVPAVDTPVQHEAAAG